MVARLVQCLAVFAACVACRVDSTTPRRSAPPLPPPGPVEIPADDPHLRYGGWFDRREPRAVRFAWPGTHIEATFEGASLTARFTDTPTEDETRETDWLAITIDDTAPVALALAEGLHDYPLATGLAPGRHRVVIWKRTEAEVGTITFHAFVLAPGGKVGPRPPAPKHRMVFIGDSVTAGYGNEGPDGKCHWSAARENNEATYGAYAARTLGAEYVAAAWSGKGLTRNYDAREAQTLPELYRRILPTDEASPSVPPGPADVVVVNVGTNDFFQGVPAKRAFIAAYVALLESLRAQYPGALLVLQVGPMLADDYPQPRARTRMREWVGLARDQRRAAGDDRCEVIEFWSNPAEGAGCDFHPNVTTHARLGRELASLVRARLGW